MMGPKLIIDKSAIQSLKPGEMEMLDRYFQIIIPPIFPLEVLGDIAIEAKKGRKGSAEDLVAALARSIQINSYITRNYRDLCIGSLLGFEPPKKAGWIIDQSHKVQSKWGTGIVIDETPVDEAVRHWQQMDFHATERKWAAMWREARKTLPLDRYRALFEKAGVDIKKQRDFPSISATVEGILQTPALQTHLLTLILDQVAPPLPARQDIIRNWQRRLIKSLPRFAKYAAFCLRANLLLALAAMNNLVKHQETSRVDIEYCYYLPQCEVFVSSDKLHRNLAEHLLGAERDFVWGEDFKADLRKRSEEWATLTEDQLRTPERRFGAPPIDMEESIISDLWRKYSTHAQSGSPL